MRGESGALTSEEVELGQRLWLRVEKVEVMGEDDVDAPDELRECAGEGWWAASAMSQAPLLVSASSLGRVRSRGKEKERRLLMLAVAVDGVEAVDGAARSTARRSHGGSAVVSWCGYDGCMRGRTRSGRVAGGVQREVRAPNGDGVGTTRAWERDARRLAARNPSSGRGCRRLSIVDARGRALTRARRTRQNEVSRA